MSSAIRFRNVSKSYRLHHQAPFLAREFVRMVLQRPSRVEEFWALRDISFEIGWGESVGVIGSNGAGKSTLLSLVARTSRPTEGEVTVQGRVAAMLELGAGFHPELTGYENIFLNGMLLGLSKQQISERLESIAEYAGLGDFLDAPTHTYSTGMTARLGFSVMAHVDPDIIILDEVLGVGDGPFQAKCRKTMESFRQAGKTMFVVSHNLGSITQLCQRAIWIEKGRIVAEGPSAEIVARYQQASEQKQSSSPAT